MSKNAVILDKRSTVLSKGEIRYIYRVFFDAEFRLKKVGFMFDTASVV
jgi:hypothetical protein